MSLNNDEAPRGLSPYNPVFEADAVSRRGLRILCVPRAAQHTVRFQRPPYEELPRNLLRGIVVDGIQSANDQVRRDDWAALVWCVCLAPFDRRGRSVSQEILGALSDLCLLGLCRANVGCLHHVVPCEKGLAVLFNDFGISARARSRASLVCRLRTRLLDRAPTLSPMRNLTTVSTGPATYGPASLRSAAVAAPAGETERYPD